MGPLVPLFWTSGDICCVTWACWIPQLHLWCNTCRPPSRELQTLIQSNVQRTWCAADRRGPHRTLPIRRADGSKEEGSPCSMLYALNKLLWRFNAILIWYTKCLCGIEKIIINFQKQWRIYEHYEIGKLEYFGFSIIWKLATWYGVQLWAVAVR